MIPNIISQPSHRKLGIRWIGRILGSSTIVQISLVIPAHNEERYLPRLLDSLDTARDQWRRGADALEVVVADNDSTDKTAQIAIR